VANRFARPICGLLLAVVFAQLHAAAGPGKDYVFRVMLDGSEIGYHRFQVSRQGDREVIEIDARFKVTFLGIPVYRYEHHNREVWRQGCLDSIASATRDGGDRFKVEGRPTARGFELTTLDGKREIESDCVMTFAYWNPEFLKQDKLLNAQNGDYLRMDIEAVGPGKLKLPDRSIDADIYRLRNADEQIDITLWYARDDGRWLSLESRVEGGRVIRYLPATAADFEDLRKQPDSADPPATEIRK
jgi:hypothetical protein